MSTRETRRDPDAERTRPPEIVGPGGDPDELAEERGAAEELLRAGDEIIDRIMTGDTRSRAFLLAGRQQGGQ
jgi:hypothetical protein